MTDFIPANLFTLGRALITSGAAEAINEAGDDPTIFLMRHSGGDWGEVDEEDAARNVRALENGERLMSVYQTTRGTRIYVITESERDRTTILLPDEY